MLTAPIADVTESAEATSEIALPHPHAHDDAAREHLEARTFVACARFVDGEAREEMLQELAAAGALIVRVPEMRASARGRLREILEMAIETALDARGAPAPSVTAAWNDASEADATLSDQLYRAARVGHSGIAVALASIAGSATPMGVLEASDGAILHFFARASRERPVAILLDAEDERLGAYRDVVALSRVIDGEHPRARDTLPEVLLESDAHVEDAHDALEEARAACDADEPNDEAAPSVDAIVHALTHSAPPAMDDQDDASNATPSNATDDDADAEEIDDGDVEEIDLEDGDVVVTAEAEVASEPIDTRDERDERGDDQGARAAVAGVPIATSEDAWRAWALALTAARGPQTLAVLEKLFRDAYVPLAHAIACGLDDPRAKSAHDDFRRSFSRAYSEALPTFPMRGRRPRMVLDAHDLAHRAARTHGARTTQLVLVDAMRFDLGMLVAREMLAELGERASLVEETILSAALPTTTNRQLETLARGSEALRSSHEAEPALESLRGRTAEVLRRIRVGSRDMMKLDLIESRLARHSTGRGAFATAMPELARDVATAIARYATSLPSRTVLWVFGDHGFTFDDTGATRQGGATPEEVLVPAFAILFGELH